MANKSTKEAAAAVAANAPATVQSTQAEIIQLPCALKYFFKYADTAWGNCRAQLPLFFEESDRFTSAYIDGQLALINQAMLLPDIEVRLSEASVAREALMARRQQVGSLAKRLRNAIGYAFKEAALAELELKAAGFDKFASPSQENWGSVSAFVTTAGNYLAAKMAKLVAAKAVKEDFDKKFTGTGTDFGAAWTDFIAKEQAAVNGTQMLNKGLEAILAELNPMLETGKLIFEFDATARRQFTTTDLLNEVRHKHPAGLSGFAKMGDMPLAGVRVEAVGQGQDKSALTDERGRYDLAIAAGTYELRFTSEGTQPLTIEARKVTAGVRGRLNVELLPRPVEVAIVAERTPALVPSDLSQGDKLNSALTEMIGEAKAMNGAVA